MVSNRQKALPRARAVERSEEPALGFQGSAHDRVRCSRSRTTTSRSGTRGLGTPRPRGKELAERDQTLDAKRRNRRSGRGGQAARSSAHRGYLLERGARAMIDPTEDASGRSSSCLIFTDCTSESDLGWAPDRLLDMREARRGRGKPGDGGVRGTRAPRRTGRQRPATESNRCEKEPEACGAS
jgi:hypothetical protein